MRDPGRASTWLATAVLGAIALVFAFPFLWMLLAAFKTNLEIFTPLPLLPSSFDPSAFRSLLTAEVIPYPRQFANSLFIALLQTLLAIGLSASAGFAFAKYDFPLRKGLFAIALAVIAIPQVAIALPLFSFIALLGLLDTPWALILPGSVTGIGVLLFTLAFRRVPDPLLQMLRSEGASEWRVFLATLPLVRSPLLAFALVHFVLSWHQHLLPLLVLTSEESKTAALGLAGLYGADMRVPYARLMAGGVFSILPTALLYCVLGRHLRDTALRLSTVR